MNKPENPMSYESIPTLVGKTLKSVVREDDEVILFTTEEGETIKMYHERDCCEQVTIDDIDGDLQDLVGNPLIVAEEATNSGYFEDEYGDSYTWTFYKFATKKGYVTIKWYGTSNGYYSESVNICKIKTD